MPVATPRVRLAAAAWLAGAAWIGSAAPGAQSMLPPDKVYDVHPKPVAQDASVRYDYDIVYVRAPRKGDARQIAWTDVFGQFEAEPKSDLVLLHPDGREEVLVAAGNDSIADPMVSFDGEWVFYSRIRQMPLGQATELPEPRSADIFKIHVKSRRVVQLTQQAFTPNTGVVGADTRMPGVFNMGPTPVPGGRVVFTSNRNGFVATKNYRGFSTVRTYSGQASMQLYVMNDDGSNVEEIGFLNINGALHPAVLADGRVMFSTYESEGLRDVRSWGIWTIYPDGTHWEPLFSAMGASSETARHFATQISDGHIVAEEYYFHENLGFGTYFKFAAQAPAGVPYFGSAGRNDPRNIDTPRLGRKPFSPYGGEALTPFAHFFNSPALPSNPANEQSDRVGKVTHPAGAPDNHLLTVWSPGPVYGVSEDVKLHAFKGPAIDSGIYLIKNGVAIDEPGKMLLIKNDSRYNEQWPRALVPYKRIYGVDEPKRLATPSNDGSASPELPAGAPYGLIGSSSLYKRETYPRGVVLPGRVASDFEGNADEDPWRGLGGVLGMGTNFFEQGADAGRYDGSDIHAIRIVVTEPTTDPRHAGRTARRWWNAANERLRILGEFPVRKFENGVQPIDPDGNPDTSFLVKLPANLAWTFQTIDRNGMVLNMSQTWHQVRPGEVRTDCGGCHSHSQAPTPWEATAAAKPGARVFDLTQSTPLIAMASHDQSKRQWDTDRETGLRFENGVKNVEYFRDVKPIFDRSCVACHTKKWAKPAGNLVLDDDDLIEPDTPVLGLLGSPPPAKVPGTFMRLAMDQHGQFGHHAGWGTKNDPRQWTYPQASRYIRYFQSRRSLLAWKIYGRRLDGFKNEDFAHESVPGDPSSITYQGKPYPLTELTSLRKVSLAYSGTAMPPPAAVSGTFMGPDGKAIKVPALTDEDRRTIARWIDLGCPIDFDFDPAHPSARGHGWLEDDNRPTLTLTLLPAAGGATRAIIGTHDYDSGIDEASLRVTSSVALGGTPAGQNLASRFKVTSPGVRELVLTSPPERGSTLTVSVKDRAGNLTTVERRE